MSISTDYKIPEEYYCPIVMEIMTKPARIIPCRHVFEKIAIEAWSQKSTTCPLCRGAIQKIELDCELEQKIHEATKHIKKEETVIPLQVEPTVAKASSSIEVSESQQSDADEESDTDEDGEAMTTLGLRYFNGEEIEQNIHSAFVCFANGAELSNPISMRMLGYYYFRGQQLHPGISTDWQLAEKYLRTAADLGDKVASQWYHSIEAACLKLGIEEHFGWSTY